LISLVSQSHPILIRLFPGTSELFAKLATVAPSGWEHGAASTVSAVAMVIISLFVLGCHLLH
jgi:hypothetical protein